MISFTGSDVLQFAVRMEENGELFYREAANSSKEGQVKNLFNHLAGEETEHKKTFGGLLSQVKSNEPPEGYPGEYMAYLRNHIDGKVFFTKENKSSLTEAGDIIKALDFAIARELDSILYYQELKAFVSPSDHKTLDAVIEAERKHVAKLSEAKISLVK